MIINGREISKNFPPYIVAEISGNHNGKIESALELIEIAKESGADAVKIQTYTPDTMTINSSREEFQIRKGPWKGHSLYDLYKWAHTPWDWHEKLFMKAKEVGITLFSTPFDETAVDYLEQFNPPAYKIASFEATDLMLIEKVVTTKRPIVVSTGMTSFAEIRDICELFKQNNKTDCAFLHCVSGYPTKVEFSNLNVIKSLIETIGFQVGLSDHTLSNTTAIASVALGAVMIEKHFIKSRDEKGPDSEFSLEPHELRELCRATKETWSAMGNGLKDSNAAEKDSLIFRRSLFFVKSLKKGEVISEQHVRRIRPGHGVSPKYYHNVLNKRALVDIEIGTPVSFDLIE